MGFAGFFPMPEFYLVFTNFSALYVMLVVAIVLMFIPRACKRIIDIVDLPAEQGSYVAKHMFSRLPWFLLAGVTVYSIFGALSADISLQNMGYANYTLSDHLIHQFGIIPVVLITSFPVFFYLVDRLGLYLGPRGIHITAIPLWVKMLMLGIVTPMLIDSLLIGYFYNRTGYFNIETLAIWFSLLALAIGGTWLAWRSIHQGLMPLESFTKSQFQENTKDTSLIPLSLDELGVLTARFAELTANLKQERDYANNIVNTSPVIMLMLDAKGYIQHVNPWFEDLTGYTLEEIKGKEWFATFLPKRDQDKIRELFHQTTHEKPTRGNINPIVTRTGDELDIEWYDQAIRDENNEFISLLAIGQDVTERKRFERTLRAQKEQYQSLLDTIPHGVQENDLNGTITFSNPTHARILGYQHDDLIGRKIWDLMLPDDKPELQQYFSHLIKDRPQPTTYVGKNVTRDGDIIDVSVDWDYKYNADGELVGFISIITDLSARMKAEQSLKQQEARLKSFFSQSLNGCFFMLLDEPIEWNDAVDKEQVLEYAFSHQRMTHINDAMLKQYGANREQFLGLTPADLMEHDLDYGKHLWRDMFDNGRLATKTKEQKLDGNPMWIEGEYVCLYDELGRITGHFGVQREITVQKQMEDELHVSEARLNEAQRIAKVGSWELDLVSNELVWSDEIFRIFEIDKSKFGATYEAFLDAIHPEDREKVNKAYSDSLVTREPYDITHRLKMKDGRIKYVRETCESFFDDNGQQIRSIGTIQDISELHLAQEQMRASEARYRRAEEGTNDGLWEWNIITGEEYFSPRWLKMLGYEPGEIPYRMETFTSLIHPDDKDNVLAAVEAHCNEGKAFNVEMRLRHKNGKYLWIQSRGQAQRDINGEPFLMSGFITDITQRRQTEAELDRYRENLEELVESRTTAMKLAWEEAERANAAKSEFLSRMSHELRTPLNAIIGFGQLMEMDPDHPLPEQQVDNLKEIQHAGQNLLELVNEVLDLSRIESGYIEVNLKPLALTPIVEQCIKQCQPQATVRNISITSELDENCCTVFADSLRLKQVLNNLISNAIKYNRDNGQVRLYYQQLSGNKVRVNVEDTGRGIAEKFQEQIFRPFERLESAYDAIEGTGIGLTLVKRLVEAMDGEVGLESTPSVGSTFWIELTVSTQAPDRAETPAVTPPPLTKSTVKKLLLVEDNLSNRRLIEAIINKQNNCMLLEAVDAKTGLRIAETEHPDLILLDINLPDLDGYEVLRRLRTNPATQETPVIAVTANAMDSDIERGKAAGFQNYLTKPIDMSSFLEVIDRYL